jgi:hypothetical protein
MDHGDASGDCAACHPSGGSDWTCYTCHEQQETLEKHDEEVGGDIAGRCLECHPNGEED